MLALDAQTTMHLDAARKSLFAEFDDVEPRTVDAHFDAALDALLAEARVPDFIAVLTRRYARERLRDGAVRSTSAPPARTRHRGEGAFRGRRVAAAS
jgi:hypothetical protein